MAGLPPGDPQLVSMIVNHLKTQGLFDQFRRDCLADVDTKPAYLNLKQRVDNFVSNHLSNHTWSPHLNKNQLRNNIRQLVLQSGMLEQGVDRIVAQVVDPKINHTFRPQVERVVQEFLSPGSYVEEYTPVLPPQEEEIPELPLNEPAPSSAPVAIAGDVAMSILDTITTLNQEATSRASSSGDKGRKGIQEELMEMEDREQEVSRVEEEIESKDDKTEVYAEEKALLMDIEALEVKTEDALEQMDTVKDNSTKSEKMEVEGIGNQEVGEDGKDKGASKTSVKSKDDDPLKSPNEKHQIKQKARERLKEEYSLEDSDLDGLSDITVSSVHTSDLSSFEEESDDEQPPSSSDDGQLSSDDEGSEQKQTSGDTGEDKERKPRRQAYVHKPFLYSRYYSDSDDEVTVEQRRRSAAKDKEDRLLKRQQNRERMEEKRRLKATQLEEQAERRKQKADSPSLEGPRAKEARKERKVLEKKMALNRKRKRDSRNDAGVSSNKKGDAVELNKKDDGKLSSAMCSKQTRKLSESDERRRRKSGSVSEDSNEPRKISDKNRTHSFILDLEQGAEELLKRPCGKFDRPSRKESHTKDRRERDRSLSEEHSKVKHKLEKKGDGHSDEARQKDGADAKLSTDDRGDKKSKGKGDKKMSGTTREARASLSEGGSEEGGLKEAVARKGKGLSSETTKVEKEREKEKVREKEKDKERVKEKEREKIKNEKVKSDLKLPQYSEFTGSPEERSDMDPLGDGIKKKEKQPRETPKRSKSQTEDKQVEKPKSKPDGKDTEKEKAKAECGLPESQKVSKHGSDMDRDPRKTREAEKGKALEKSRSKSREELKALKVDKKPPGPEVKSKAGAAGSRSDSSKERKRDGSAKERKGSEDIAIDKLESKSAKKVSEKKKKMLEKKGESLEETVGSKGEEPSAKSSISSPSLDTEGSPRRATLLKDTSTDSDPAATATTACDDAYDALSDITPEPEDGDLKERLREVEPCSLPAEADALLTLMDVCASADARLEPRGDPGGTEEGASRAGEAPARAIQDADTKMKEAALTLLSMDPDCKASPSSVATGTQREPEVGNPTDAKQMETSAPEEHVQALCKTYPTSRSTEKPLAAQDALGDDKKEPVVPKVQTPANVEPLEDGTFSKENQKDANNEKISDLETPPELIEAPGKTESEPKEAELESVDAEKAKTQFDFAEEETVVVEENQVKMDVDNISGGQIETEEDKAKPQSVKSDAPVETEEVRQTRRGRPPKLVKQSSNASKSDGTVDDKDKVPEHRSPRRGRLSKSATGDEEEQPTEAEQPEETPVRRSRRSGEQAKENPSSHQKKDAERKDEDSAETTSVKNPEEKPEKEEKTEQKRGGRRGRPAKFPSPKPEAKAPSPQQGATEEAAGCQSSKTIDARKPALKRKRSEEPEELNTESLDSDQPERGGTPPKEEMASPTEHRAEEKEEGPGDGKPEESSPQGEEDRETPQKKPLRRGRAWKRAVAASEHSDDKEMDPKEEEEDGDIQDDEEGSKAVTKTRAASRLEAERNKPSKPSTRARGQNAREEPAGGTRGTRGQAAAATKGGRKRDASPPAVRTRGGQKSEEPPSKRAKR